MPLCGYEWLYQKKYNNQLYEELDLDKEFSYIPQNNAHLCKKAADHYYKLYFALLDYINKKYSKTYV